MYEYIGKIEEKRKKCWTPYGEEEIWKKKMYKKKRLNNEYIFFSRNRKRQFFSYDCI